MKLNERLQLVASLKNIKPVSLAKDMGVDKSTFSKWWRGKREPRPENIMAIAKIIGCNYSYLAFEKGEPFPKTPTQQTEMVQTGANSTQAGRDINARDVHSHATEKHAHLSEATKYLLEILDKLPNKEDMINKFVFEALQEMNRQKEEKKDPK